MAIRNRLRELRRGLGKSQETVVQEIEHQQGERPFGRAMLSHFERHVYQPTGDALDALCRYYGVQPGDILHWVETPDRTDGALAA